ncbi:hypothetical protein [Fibrella arboris]|uniref:hypothetical protein n=1 Tax=Fibrella arboris TaxID=3242486 RepID=UPI0035210C9B
MVILICGHPVIGIYKSRWQVRIRLYTVCSLIFFAASLPACQSADQSAITIQWDGKRATGLTISDQLTSQLPADSMEALLAVRLAGQQTAIAGHYEPTSDGIRFEPLIPFTRGRQYTVWLRHTRIYELTIPALAADDTPKLLAVYPSSESLPDNLLKVYLRFSRPMRENQSARYVALRDADGDTLRQVFLDLQPELWNADRTILTLWLDPGRIKRELQPNKRLGAPLQTGNRYQLVVSPGWPDALGATLAQAYTKKFQVTRRDSLSPVPASWSVRPPKPGSSSPLTIVFGESLDYALLTETMRVLQEIDRPSNGLAGTWQIGPNETSCQFRPAAPWIAGRYRLRIENRLEDLAGNNLIRPFDRDITRSKRTDNGPPYKDIIFDVRP